MHRSPLPLVAILMTGSITQVFLWVLMAVLGSPVSGISIVWANLLGALLIVHVTPCWRPKEHSFCSVVTNVVAVLAGVAGLAYYTPWAGKALAYYAPWASKALAYYALLDGKVQVLTVIAHLCALTQGMIVGITLGYHGEFFVRGSREDDGGIFNGVLSSATHFLCVQMCPLIFIAFSWVSILDKLLLQLFTHVTGAHTLSKCMMQLTSHLQNPFLGTVDCSFDLANGPGIALDGHVNSDHQIYGTVRTQWLKVEWAPPVFIFLRFSIPLMCLVLFIYSLARFLKEGAVSYRSGLYISFTWELNRSPVHMWLAGMIRITLCISLILLLLIGFVWVFLLVQIRHDDSALGKVKLLMLFLPEILPLYGHYMTLTVGSSVYPMIILALSTYKLTSSAPLGWDTPAFSCVMMKPRPGMLKLQDNRSVAKHITEALWLAHRGNMQKLERLVESPDAQTVLNLCTTQDNIVRTTQDNTVQEVNNNVLEGNFNKPLLLGVTT